MIKKILRCREAAAWRAKIVTSLIPPGWTAGLHWLRDSRQGEKPVAIWRERIANGLYHPTSGHNICTDDGLAAYGGVHRIRPL